MTAFVGGARSHSLHSRHRYLPRPQAPGPCPSQSEFQATWVVRIIYRAARSHVRPLSRVLWPVWLSDQDAVTKVGCECRVGPQPTVHFYLAPTPTLIASRALPQIARHRILFASALSVQHRKVVVRPFDDPSVHSPCTAVGSQCSLERERAQVSSTVETVDLPFRDRETEAEALQEKRKPADQNKIETPHTKHDTRQSHPAGLT